MLTHDDEESRAHEPVLLDEVIRWLEPERGGIFVDCTLGPGGHSEAMLRASPETKVIGIDRDIEALELAQKRLAIFENRFQTVHAGFDELGNVLTSLNVKGIQGGLADLGVSSLQLDHSERGFSFTQDAPLDMRMDQGGGETAAEIVNRLPEAELADLIFGYGEERGSRKIARAIIRERERQPIATTGRLAEIIVRALKVPGRWRIHPATRTFQALRIAVNDELNALERFIPDAISALESGGRLAIISFHSLEDRIVKRRFLLESGRCNCPVGMRRSSLPIDSGEVECICAHCGAQRRVSILTRKPVRPSQAEVERNPRARSALLRVCEKI